jgi:hypothetical protein
LFATLLPRLLRARQSRLTFACSAAGARLAGPLRKQIRPEEHRGVWFMTSAINCVPESISNRDFFIDPIIFVSIESRLMARK